MQETGDWKPESELNNYVGNFGDSFKLTIWENCVICFMR